MPAKLLTAIIFPSILALGRTGNSILKRTAVIVDTTPPGGPAEHAADGRMTGRTCTNTSTTVFSGETGVHPAAGDELMRSSARPVFVLFARLYGLFFRDTPHPSGDGLMKFLIMESGTVESMQ